jgi:hypothetical protein
MLKYFYFITFSLYLPFMLLSIIKLLRVNSLRIEHDKNTLVEYKLIQFLHIVVNHFKKKMTVIYYIVTCWEIQATNKTGSSSDDWIY